MHFFKIKFILGLLLLFICEIIYSQDSTYKLIASRRNKIFVFEINSSISVIHSDNEYYSKKAKGKITNITDSSVTIYSLIKDKSFVVPIKNITRFSKANNSLLRYITFVTIGSIIAIAGIEGNGYGFDNYNPATKSNGNIQAFEYAAYMGLGSSYMLFYPSLIGEICKKHFIHYGWKLHCEKVKRVQAIPFQ